MRTAGWLTIAGVLFVAAAVVLALGFHWVRPAAAPSGVAGSGSWSATATGMGTPGNRLVFDCPPGGTSSTVWGDGTYTADSSVCTAAVHSGLLTFARGGQVTIEVAAGRSSYSGVTRHGVTTHAYGSWSQSFHFPASSWLGSFLGPKGSPTPTPVPSPPVKPWTPVPFQSPRVGDRKTVDCAGLASSWGTVWGTDVYTADSNECAAAVHAGVLASGASGKATLEYVPGERAYQGTTRNGVTSQAWRDYPTSFVFAGGRPVPRSIEAAFVDAGIDGLLDRTAVSGGPVVWEVSVFRDGTVLLSERRERRLLNVVAKATASSSDPETVRLALIGTLHRYGPTKTTSTPLEAQIVLAKGIAGYRIVEESRSIGMGADGIELTDD